MRYLLVFLGNILYHFDRALFSLLIPFLAPLFFPHIDPLYALIAMFIISPLEAFVKPLGALVFGYWGDKIGRRKILSITMMGMAIKTAFMGFLPTYEQIGIYAPLLLAFVRLTIGFFSAGETTGGAIFLLEKSEQKKRNFISSLFDASGILGILLASSAIYFFHSYPHFWRILFWIGGGIGVIGWMFRKLPDDPKVFSEPLMSCGMILWKYKKEVVAVAAVAGFSYANYFLITSFMNGFLPLISTITKAEAISFNSILLGVDFLLLPLFGLISLKISKKTLMLTAILGIVLCVCPLFLLLQKATLYKAAFVRMVLTLFGVCLAAPYHAWVYETTPPSHRYLIGAFGTAIGAKLFGAPLPALSLWLYQATGLVVSATIPLIIVGVLPLIFLLKQDRKASLPYKSP